MSKELLDEMRTKGYITPEEASEMSKVPQSTIYAWARDGVLGEVKRHGRRRMFVSLDKLREVAGESMQPEPEGEMTQQEAAKAAAKAAKKKKTKGKASEEASA